MKALVHLSLIAIALLAANAQAGFRLVEQAIEATPAQITLPSSIGGGMTVRECPSCAPRSLKTTASTEYLVAGQALSLSEFARFLADNPNLNLTVMTSVRDGSVTRVKVQSRPAAQGSAPAR
jgi:hypothetical protein